MSKWHEGTLVGYDTETTAADPHEARIITASIVYARPGARPIPTSWLLNLGVDVPDEAAQVHGWTTARLNDTVPVGQALRTANGAVRPLRATDALNEIRNHLVNSMAAEAGIVIFNAPYDTTVTDHELQRAAAQPIGWKGIIDPPVLEKQWDPYRKVKGGCRGGKHKCGGCGAVDKKLTSLCAHYGIVHTGAHDSTGDALASVRLARKLAEVWPDIARLKLETIHRNQADWRLEQAKGLREYFDKIGQEHDGVCGEWPVHRSCSRQEALA